MATSAATASAVASFSLSSVENLPPDVMRRLAKELVDLRNEPPEGIRVQINEKDLADVQCTIDGPDGTPYAGGQFRVKLVLPKDFPASPPKGFFLTKIFHPNVASPGGDICVNVLKRDWNASLGLRHILLTIKCLLIDPNPESALNDEAGRLLLENYASYAKRAKMITEVHARPARGQNTESSTCANADASCSSLKRAAEEEAGLETKKQNKEKERVKKSLKRL